MRLSCLFDSVVKVDYCLDVEFVNVVPKFCACFVGCIFFVLRVFLLCKLCTCLE